MMMRCLVMFGVSSVLLGCGGICGDLTALYDKGAACEGGGLGECCIDVGVEMVGWLADNMDKAEDIAECSTDEGLTAAVAKHATACR